MTGSGKFEETFLCGEDGAVRLRRATGTHVNHQLLTSDTSLKEKDKKHFQI